MIGHCDPARGGSSRSLRSASGGEAKGGDCESCKEFADGVMLEVGCWKLDVGGLDLIWFLECVIATASRAKQEAVGS